MGPSIGSRISAFDDVDQIGNRGRVAVETGPAGVLVGRRTELETARGAASRERTRVRGVVGDRVAVVLRAGGSRRIAGDGAAVDRDREIDDARARVPGEAPVPDGLAVHVHRVDADSTAQNRGDGPVRAGVAARPNADGADLIRIGAARQRRKGPRREIPASRFDVPGIDRDGIVEDIVLGSLAGRGSARRAWIDGLEIIGQQVRDPGERSAVGDRLELALHLPHAPGLGGPGGDPDQGAQCHHDENDHGAPFPDARCALGELRSSPFSLSVAHDFPSLPVGADQNRRVSSVVPVMTSTELPAERVVGFLITLGSGSPRMSITPTLWVRTCSWSSGERMASWRRPSCAA